MARPLQSKGMDAGTIYSLVCRWVETGNFTRIAEETGLVRQTISDNVHKWIERNPEEYKNIVDTFWARNKQELIFKNNNTTHKALDKVNELLEDTTSLKEASMAYGILYDKGALMKGESTSNTAIVIKMKDDIEELSK